jgi:hypothetical protein
MAKTISCGGQGWQCCLQAGIADKHVCPASFSCLFVLSRTNTDFDEGRGQPHPSPVVVDGEEEYQVERLLDVRKVRRGGGYRQEFLVKWLG